MLRPKTSQVQQASPEEIATEVARLADLSRGELLDRWRALYGTEPPKMIRADLLIRAIAYKLQERAFGGLSPATRRRLRQIAQDLKTKGDAAITPPPRLKPGTRLVRAWKGEVHEVSVLEEGFAWRGVRHNSLSQIARIITGTHWNGWTFFGAKPPARRSPDRARIGIVANEPELSDA